MTEKPQTGRRRGRPTVPIVLSDDERHVLERWTHQRTSSQALSLRSRIVLACAEDLLNVEVGKRLGVHPATVGKWRGRFARRRLEGLVDEPRPGAPRTITDERVAEVIATTLNDRPTDATRWSTRAMARATGMSQTAISRIWRAAGLKPHLDEADQTLENTARRPRRIPRSGHSGTGRPSDGESAALARKRERETAILRAALEAVREKGLAETRMIDIARRVHMSPGHVLYYFPSKRALLMEALQWSEDTFHQRAAEELARATTAWERLLRLIALSAPTGEGDPQWLLWLETWANAPHDEAIARHQAELGRRWIARIVAVVREGQERGEFAPIPAHPFALRLTALTDGLAIMVVTGAGQMSRDRMLEDTRLWAAEQLGVRRPSPPIPPLTSWTRPA